MYPKKKYDRLWRGKIEPFKVVGNVYFVGCYEASTHLIDTDEGLILIDPGYLKTFHIVIDSIYRLGFDPRDIKYIVNTHWHNDHTEAAAALADLCGAKTLIGENDAENARRYFEPDILICDGDTLALGNTRIRFAETPGHTVGTVSFFFDVEENGNTYRVGSFGGAGRNTLVRGKFDFEGCREAYFDSIERLKREKVDVFLGNHVWNNNTDELAEILRTTGENKFIDPSLWERFLTNCENKLKEIISKEDNC